MKTKRLLSALALACLLPLSAWADVYQDPETKVNYEYEPRSGVASVKAGSDWYQPGSPEVFGDITILSMFTVDGQEYLVKKISKYAFGNCSSITKVELPEELESIEMGAFYGCSAITSIIIPASVNSIGQSAFSCCGLTSVSIPISVTSIESNTFDGCSDLKSVEIPNSVTSIGSLAFNLCNGLTSINIPGSVTSIGSGAFSNCSGLTSVFIPKSIINIDDEGSYYGHAFNGCVLLSTIVVEDGNPVYDSRDNCNAIVETATNKLIVGCNGTTIPNSITVIGSNAFKGSGITSVYIPSSVTKIGDFQHPNPFRDCKSLESIVVDDNNEVYDSRSNCNAIIETSSNIFVAGCRGSVIPENVNIIGHRAFEECTWLTSMSIPDHVTTIEWRAFEWCENLRTINLPNSIKVIGSSAFRYCTNLESINIPNGVTTIEDNTFECCYELKHIDIPLGVTTIGKEVFYGSGLRSIEMPSSVLSIGNRAFESCTWLTNVIIPFGVNNIDSYAFYKCYSLNSVVIPSSVSSIGSYALSSCTQLKQVTSYITEPFEISSVFPSNYSTITLIVPYGKKSIYESTTGWNRGLKIIEMSESDSNSEYVDGSDFIAKAGNDIILRYTVVSAEDKTCKVSGILTDSYHSDDVDVAIPEKVNGLKVIGIGDEAFKGCGLTSVTIPASVESIGEMAFYGNPMTSIVVDESNPNFWSPENSNAILHRSEDDWKIELIVGCNATIIPQDVEKIGKLAFGGCPGLVSITIPYGISSIGEGAFYDCNDLTNITIPSTVKKIGSYFCDDDNEELSIISCIKDPSDVSIDGIWYGSATLYVPKGTKSLYEAVSGWKNFNNIVEMDETPVFDGETFTAENEDGLELRYQVISAEDKTCRLMGFSDWPGEEANITLNIPKKANGLNVTAINEGAFGGCGLTSVSIPASVTSIGEYAFAGNSLTSIQVNYNNKVYDSRNNCNAIIETASDKLITGSVNTVIPNGIKTIGTQAFAGCRDLDHINIPKTVQIIEGAAFYNCGLTSITIPSSVTSLASGTFWGCPLESIMVEEGNPVYDSRNGCNAIIETATNTLVAGCSNTIIPDGIETIGELAFADCKKLTSIDIPQTVSTIGAAAFQDCTGLTSVLLRDGVTGIGSGAFIGCGLKRFIIPATVKSLGPGVCSGKKVGDEYGPYTYESIDKIISHITTPSEVNLSETIVDNRSGEVFYTDPRDVFMWCRSATLYVPKGTKELYEETEGWDVFANIVEMDDTIVVPVDVNGDGEADESDIESIANHVAGKNVESFDEDAADIDMNGVVDIRDLTLLIKALVNGE